MEEKRSAKSRGGRRRTGGKSMNGNDHGHDESAASAVATAPGFVSVGNDNKGQDTASRSMVSRQPKVYKQQLCLAPAVDINHDDVDKHSAVPSGTTSTAVPSYSTGRTYFDRKRKKVNSEERLSLAPPRRLDSDHAPAGHHVQGPSVGVERADNAPETYDGEMEILQEDANVAVTLEATLVEEGGSVGEEDREQLREEIRNEFLQNVVVVGQAEKVDEDDVEEGICHRRNLYKLAGILLVAVILVVVIAVVVRNNNNGDGTETSFPPPSSSGPSDTDRNSEPSAQPSYKPSSVPTVSIENLDNSLMDEAHPLVIGAEPLVVTAESAQERQQFGVDCGLLLNYDTFGLWYIYRPRRSGSVTVVGCGGFFIQVFRSPSIGILNCLFDDTSKGDIDNCNGDSVSWMAEAGAQYFILMETDPSTLAPEITGARAPEYSIKIVDNDQCQYAHGPLDTASAIFSSDYSTEQALQSNTSVSACGSSSEAMGPGIWYQVQGNGGAITASTCSDNTNFDTQISVFSGECDGLLCVRSNDDSCGQQSRVEWFATEGEMYYVYVHGYNGTTGDFDLEISGDFDRLGNDFCETANEVPSDGADLLFGGATTDPEMSVCAAADMFAADSAAEPSLQVGTWYSVIGHGGTIEIILGSNNLVPVELRFFSGNCGNLECLDIELDSAAIVGGGAVTEFHSEFLIENTIPGQSYYLLLSTNEEVAGSESGALLTAFYL